jgi:polyisoprenoid-binding protein YceI
MVIMSESPAVSQSPVTESPVTPSPVSPPPGPSQLPPGRYRIDAGRSAVTFTTRHLFGLARVRGTLALRDGTVDVADPVGGSTVRARVAASTFRTGNPVRDAAVLSARLLDAEAYPALTFTSADVVCDPGAPAGPGLLRGELEVRGVPRPVEVRVTGLIAGGASEPGETGITLHASARFSVDRYDFGITAYRGLAARWLTIDLSIVAELTELPELTAPNAPRTDRS